MGLKTKKGVLSRRQFLKTAGAGCAGVVMAGSIPSLISPAFGQKDVKSQRTADADKTRNIRKILKKYFGDRKINMSRINLKVPLIAENGAVVPVTVTSDLPMEKEKFVKKMYVFVDGNINPLIASVDLVPANGKAEIAMRIKMRETSNVRAVAEMSDGTLYGDIKSVKVTRGGCGGV